jgi:hypothetical protein
MVAVLAAAYPNSSISEQTAEVYEVSLADLDVRAAELSVQRLVATSRFMPTVSEIRETACSFALGSKRTGGEAWGDVLLAIRRTGSYGKPRFSDALAAECVRLMGWRNLCLSENDAADRARFIELYDNLTDRERANQAAGINLALPPPGSPMRELLGHIGRRIPEPKMLSRADVERQKAELAKLDRPEDQP